MAYHSTVEVWHKGLPITIDYSRGPHDVLLETVTDELVLEDGETSPFILDCRYYHQRYMDYAEDYFDGEDDFMKEDFEAELLSLFEEYILSEQKKLAWTPQTDWLD